MTTTPQTTTVVTTASTTTVASTTVTTRPPTTQAFGCYKCVDESTCAEDNVPLEICEQGEVCATANITGFYLLPSGFPTTGDEIFRQCFPTIAGPDLTSGCISAQRYYDYTNSPLVDQLFAVVGRVCFCDTHLCNDMDIPQQVPATTPPSVASTDVTVSAGSSVPTIDCYVCTTEEECKMETVPSKMCKPDEICISVNISAIVNGVATSQISRDCAPKSWQPESGECISSLRYIELISPPGVALPPTTDHRGRACFCEFDLCNDRNIRQEPFEDFILEVEGTFPDSLIIRWSYSEDIEIDGFIIQLRPIGVDTWFNTSLIDPSLREFRLTDLGVANIELVRLIAVDRDRHAVSLSSTRPIRVLQSGQRTISGSTFVSSPQFWVAIILAVVACTVIIVIAITLAGRKYWKMDTQFEDDDEDLLPLSGRTSLRSSRRSASYDIEAIPMRSVSRQASFKSQTSVVTRTDLEMARSDITIGKVCSSEDTHDIFHGQIIFGNKTKSVYLRHTKGEMDKRKVREELTALKLIADNPHVIPFLGTCTKDGPYYLIFGRDEIARLDVWLKDLHKAHRPLRKRSPDFNVSATLMPQLLQFGVDVVNGLGHLASVNCVAHHLGAKNVVLTEDLVAKIADYPPSVSNNGKPKRSQKTKDSRWMAFETLLYNTYSSKTTTWSCGLILWEIMSYGQKPFSEVQLEDIWQHLAGGNTISQPQGCPSGLFDIIKRCLLLEPKERLSIELVVRLMETRYKQMTIQTEVEFMENTNSLKILAKENSRQSSLLLELLAKVNMKKTRHVPSRMMAVQYAAAFPADNVLSKFVLLQACGDENEALTRRAQQLLDEHIRLASEDVRNGHPLNAMMPSFPAMVMHVKQQASEALPRSSVKTRSPLGVFNIPFNPVAYQKIAEYLRMSLAYSCGLVPDTSSVDDKMLQAPQMTGYINTLHQLDEDSDRSPLTVYVGMLRQFVSATGSADAVYQLLEVVAMAPDHLAPPFIPRVDQLKMLLHSEDRTVQQLAAELLGLVLCYAKSTLAEDYMQKATKSLQNPSLDTQRVSLWSLGHIISSQMKKEREAGRDTFIRLEDETKLTEDNLYRLATEAIVTKLQHNNLTVVQAACFSLSVIAQQGPLPLPKGGEESASETVSKLDIVHLLTDIVSDRKLPIEVRQEGAAGLCNLLVGDEKFPFKKLVVNSLMATVETCLDDIPLQLKFADALVTALEGHRSYKSRDPWREASRRRDGKAQAMNGDLEKVFDALLRNEEYQESASIYFLVLMEAYRYHPYVQKRFNVLKTFITKTVRTMEESGVLGETGEEDKLRIMQCLVRLK